MNKSLYTIITFARINTRRFFRDKLSIFFGILFPLIFLFVFGGIFGKSDSASFRVALINQSNSEFSKQFVTDLKKEKSLKIDDTEKSLNDASEKMTRSQLDAAIVLPESFGAIDAATQLPGGQAKVFYTQNNASAGQTLSTILDGVFKGINQKLTRSAQPFSVKGEQLQNKSLTQFDYTYAGHWYG